LNPNFGLCPPPAPAGTFSEFCKNGANPLGDKGVYFLTLHLQEVQLVAAAMITVVAVVGAFLVWRKRAGVPIPGGPHPPPAA
jgi:hypothetical protein